MNNYFPHLVSSFLLLSCSENPNKSETKDPDTNQLKVEIASPEKAAAVSQTQKLGLTSEGLQVISVENGSTQLLAYGRGLEELVPVINKVLGFKVTSVQVNQECGAGPLKMATWRNGLILVFQENKKKSEPEKEVWEFAGWFINDKDGNSKKLTTMSGVGVGATKAELESDYVVDIKQTSLGQEFSTTAGLYGILSGTGPEASITYLWSGLSCNFR